MSASRRLLPLTEGWGVHAVGPEEVAGKKMAGGVPEHIAEELAGRRLPATVPGVIHLDLLAAGLIEDPYVDDHESTLTWIGEVTWRYETTFSGPVPPPVGDPPALLPVVDLIAAGLDTFATVELNGVELGQTANMHRRYRFRVTELLHAGENRLRVTFAAPRPETERAAEATGRLPHVNPHPFNAVRKMACNYGWDWGPDLVTSGIWRPLSLETWTGARIAAVRPLVTIDGTRGRLEAYVDLERAPDLTGDLRVQVEVGGTRVEGRVAAGSTSTVVEVEVPDVRVWAPIGHGEPTLYPVDVTVSRDGPELDRWTGRVGFRVVTLDTEPDEHGRPFQLAVNGTDLFVRGVNWIPDDCFPSQMTRARYARRLHQARDAGANLVRVWGGGIYESEDFYDLCDELGLMVWQDFAFACAAYAEEEPLRAEVVAEARENVTRLSPHPSLVLWNGCNENIWGWWDWGWAQEVRDRSWGWGYYTDLLPALIFELDPTRPYSPGSPYSFDPQVHANDAAHGTMHIWDVWNERDQLVYRDHRPRFAAEFGFQGPPTWSTLIRAVHDDPLTPESPHMLVHQKAEDGSGKLRRGLEGHLPVPEDVEDWHWATSLNQARAVRLGIEHLRSLSPYCAGAVLWQLNDCWPVTSWSVVDGDGRLKPAWFALRSAFSDRLVTLQPRDGSLAAVLVNDSPEAWSTSVTTTRRRWTGEIVAENPAPVVLAPRETVTVPLPASVGSLDHRDGDVVLAEADGHRAWWHLVEDVDARLPTPDLNTHLEETTDGYRLTVTTRTFVRDLALLVDRVDPDAEVDEMLVTLLPGESTTFAVTTTAILTHAALTDPLVLRCSNQLLP